MANSQEIFQGTSGTMIEFALLHSGGNTISGASLPSGLLVSFISPGDTSLKALNNPEIVEMSPNIASGHYLVRPNFLMVDKPGTLVVYASGVGKALGQAGVVQSTLTTVYIDVIAGEPDEYTVANDFTTGVNKFGYSVLPASWTRTDFKLATYGIPSSGLV